VKKLFILAVTGLFSIAGWNAAAAENYPQRPIRMIVPASPGGGTDFAARLINDHLAKVLGQSVVIENKPGASGTIGAAQVAHSKPDGYTVLMAQSTSMVIAPHIYKNLSYDPLKDLTPVTLVALVPNVLVVNPGVHAKSVKELIALDKATPGSLSFGSSGKGAPSDLAGLLFNKMTGTHMVPVRFKGAGPSVSALLGDHIQVMFPPINSVLPLIKSGKLRALALTTRDHLKAMPDLPTLTGSGLAGYEISSWFGVFAPAGTPQAIVDKLYQATADALKQPKVVETFEKQGAHLGGNTPQAFSAFVHSENTRYATFVKDLSAHF
jgi:tripartite-type tricarboxylate transporter receptor subunit TctC